MEHHQGGLMDVKGISLSQMYTWQWTAACSAAFRTRELKGCDTQSVKLYPDNTQIKEDMDSDKQVQILYIGGQGFRQDACIFLAS